MQLRLADERNKITEKKRRVLLLWAKEDVNDLLHVRVLIKV